MHLKATFEHLDPLLGVAPKGTRDAETFDLLYRSALWTAAGDDTGELCIKVPTAAMDIVPGSVGHLSSLLVNMVKNKGTNHFFSSSISFVLVLADFGRVI